MPPTTERKRKKYIDNIASKIDIGQTRNESAKTGIHIVPLCTTGVVEMPMGDAKQKWFGMLPPDRMHLWWEGMGKHVLNWTLLLIDFNAQHKSHTKTTGDLAMLDFILANMEYKNRCIIKPGVSFFKLHANFVKHSDRDTPSLHVASGVSNTKTIPAKHMVPLLVQVQLAIGVNNVFFPPSQQKKVHEVFAGILHLAWQLHMDEYCESQIVSLQSNIKTFLQACKTAFRLLNFTMCFILIFSFAVLVLCGIRVQEDGNIFTNG